MPFLPQRDRGYLAERGYSFSEIEDGGQKALVLHDVSLPAGRYDVATVDVLVLLPPGFPDVGPDMFYTNPWVRLVPQGCHPKAADQPQPFQGKPWQRWSRHSSEWRAGRDGIHTVITRVHYSFETAQP